jgi:hypothetical protein
LKKYVVSFFATDKNTAHLLSAVHYAILHRELRLEGIGAYHMSQASLKRAYDEVVSFFASGPSPKEMASFHLSDNTIARVRDLLLKNSEGTLSPDESEELDQCMQLDRMIMLIRTQARKNQQEDMGR